MRSVNFLAPILLLAFGSALATPPSTLRRGPVPEKSSQPTGIPNPQPHVGGEDISTAVPIPALPYSDTGNTCAYLDDYDEVCPFSGSLAPDVVYSYSPPADTTITISLCDSYYDTKIFVYENIYTPGTPYACNDDRCSGPNYANPYLSLLDCVPVSAGNIYYIVVDGYFGSCGQYVLNVTGCDPCAHCPANAIIEGEPECSTDYVDQYNGGCNSSPPVFSNLSCGYTMSICGTYGGFTYNGLSYRDTDWYQVHVPAGGYAAVEICVTGQLPTTLGYIDGNLGCDAPAFETYALLDACEEGCFVVNLPPGLAWIFCATSGFGPGYPCGSDYVMTIVGLVCDLPVEQTTWGEIKAKYGE